MIYSDKNTGKRLSGNDLRQRAYPASLPSKPDTGTLETLNVEPIHEASRPTAQPWQRVIEVTPMDTDNDGIREQQWEIEDRPVEDVRADKKSQINRLRDQGIFSGSVNWTRPSDGVTIPVDMRSQRDRDNLQDLRSSALVLDQQGVTDAVMQFRAADDAIYDLTPQDMVAMSQAMMQRGQAWYAAAWAHKDAVAALTTAQEIADYDHTSGWPN